MPREGLACCLLPDLRALYYRAKIPFFSVVHLRFWHTCLGKIFEKSIWSHGECGRTGIPILSIATPRTRAAGSAIVDTKPHSLRLHVRKASAQVIWSIRRTLEQNASMGIGLLRSSVLGPSTSLSIAA